MCNFLGIATVILGFAAIDRLHILSVPQQTGKHALHGYHEILAIRSNSFQKDRGRRGHISVEQDLPVSV